MIRESDKNLLKDLFQKELTNPVKLIMFTQEKSPLILPVTTPCEWCKETEDLVKEIAELSENINVEIYDFVKDENKAKELAIDKIPAIALIGKEDYGIRFYGIPAGYEFTTLIEDIIDVSKGTTKLSQKTKERLKDIKKDINIQVFVTPTWPYCPKAVRLAHQMAIENAFIKSSMIEAQEFPHLAQKYDIFGVPKTIINEEYSFEGALPEEAFLSFVLKAAGELNPEEHF